MTCDKENTTDTMLTRLLPILGNGDENRFRDVLQLLLNASMLAERQQHLRAQPHERTDERNGYANGFKDREFQTRLGALELRVPQVRESSEPFYPQSLERGLRSERALKIALAEMYVQGVSTRKVAAITLIRFAIQRREAVRVPCDYVHTLVDQYAGEPGGGGA